MRDPELVSRAQRAAARLEWAWERWRTRHGLGGPFAQPVASYVGYSPEEPRGRPRVVFGVDAVEAEQLAALLDVDARGPVTADGPGLPAPDGYRRFADAHAQPCFPGQADWRGDQPGNQAGRQAGDQSGWQVANHTANPAGDLAANQAGRRADADTAGRGSDTAGVIARPEPADPVTGLVSAPASLPAAGAAGAAEAAGAAGHPGPVHDAAARAVWDGTDGAADSTADPTAVPGGQGPLVIGPAALPGGAAALPGGAAVGAGSAAAGNGNRFAEVGHAAIPEAGTAVPGTSAQVPSGPAAVPGNSAAASRSAALSAGSARPDSAEAGSGGAALSPDRAVAGSGSAARWSGSPVAGLGGAAAGSSGHAPPMPGNPADHLADVRSEVSPASRAADATAACAGNPAVPGGTDAAVPGGTAAHSAPAASIAAELAGWAASELPGQASAGLAAWTAAERAPRGHISDPPDPADIERDGRAHSLPWPV